MRGADLGGRREAGGEAMELKLVPVAMPEDANVIIGQSHFIKTVEDLYEIMATGVPGAAFGLAFNEASGACLVRAEGNDEGLRAAAIDTALSLGAGRWHTVMTVILPAALPGILTGTVISMGRAAGETAPIIFTAAVSVGRPLNLFTTRFWEILSQPTPALPWNVYNLCTEHEAVDEIRHVQYGMVLALVLLVLLLNATAIILRARISKKLRG